MTFRFVLSRNFAEIYSVAILFQKLMFNSVLYLDSMLWGGGGDACLGEVSRGVVDEVS